MTQITSFTRPVVKELRDEVTAALESVGKRYGITLKVNGIRYDDNMFSTKVEARLGTDTNEHARNDWENNCRLFGLAENDFGKKFIQDGEEFTVVGIKPRSPKYPILCRTRLGKVYKMSSSIVGPALHL